MTKSLLGSRFVSGTGNVATNNQDANNTGTNGNTAPPAAPTAKVNVEVFYVHPDHLGTPRVITASTALAATTGTGITSPQTVNKAVWRWDSDPFGSNATANSAPNENPNTLSQVVGASTLPYLFGFDLAFPGQKRDRETGKHYNYFRDYDPAVGQYFESDPIGLRGGISTFGYVRQHPLRHTDRRGLNSDPPPMDIGDPIIRPPVFPKTGSICAVNAFLRNYNDMRAANTIGADKYFHCKANCEASRCGPKGPQLACDISDGREWFDRRMKGEPPPASDADQIANAWGRDRSGDSGRCEVVCGIFRPNGLPSRY